MSENYFKSDIVCYKHKSSIRIGRITEVEVAEKSASSNNSTGSDDKELELAGGDGNESQESSSAEFGTELWIMWNDDKRWGNGMNVTPKLCLWGVSPKVPLKVLDRGFKVGQKVTAKGEIGTITGCDRLTTLSIIGSDQVPMVIPDVKLSSIAPITDLFYGVMIEYEGWIGQITEVKRKAIWTIGDAEFSTMHYEPSLLNKLSYLSPHITGKGYPYIATSPLEPYPGKARMFTDVDLRRYAYFEGEVDFESLSKLQAVVKTVEPEFVRVTWLGRLPPHLDSKSKVPPTALDSSGIFRIRSLYINPATYLDKNGTSIYTGREGDRILPEFQWKNELFDATKDKTLCEDAIEGQIFYVRKMFSRHLYRVGFDKEERFCFGDELNSVTEDFCVINGFIFCKRIDSRNADEYGVLLEKDCNSSLLIQWLKIMPNGSVIALDQSRCESNEVKKHPIFGELTDSRIVVKSRLALDLGFAYGFTVGTIVKIDRFKMGEILVFCSSSREFKLMWPHELEIFQEMSLVDRVKWLK